MRRGGAKTFRRTTGGEPRQKVERWAAEKYEGRWGTTKTEQDDLPDLIPRDYDSYNDDDFVSHEVLDGGQGKLVQGRRTRGGTWMVGNRRWEWTTDEWHEVNKTQAR